MTAIQPDLLRVMGRVAAIAALVLLTMAAAPPPNTPMPSTSPGDVRTDLTQRQICATRWGSDRRHVTEAMKRDVFRAYGYPDGNADSRCPCEVDHIISRELGGADTVQNLMIQSYRGDCNARDKDRVENALAAQMCRGGISLWAAQQQVYDWIPTYQRLFGKSCYR